MSDRRARVLLSGGMDSAASLAWARCEFEWIDAVFFSYGQRHEERELAAARALARHFGIRLWEVALGRIGGSSLTGGGGDLAGPSVVVPGRNAIMLRQAASMFSVPGVVVMGCCRDDWRVFADCRPEFFDGMRRELHHVGIETPLIDMDKAGVIGFARRYGGSEILGLSWSCYAGGADACGGCSACAARLRGFWAVGAVDPCAYASDALRVPCVRCMAPAGARCHHPNHGWTDPCAVRWEGVAGECGDWSPSYDAHEDELVCASCGDEHVARSKPTPCGSCDECNAGIRCRELGP